MWLGDEDEKRFAACGLTCLGGSEQRACECLGQADCKMRGHHAFDARRVVATRRLVREVKADKAEADAKRNVS